MSHSLGKRNNGFDFLKYICAFLIICIHSDYQGAEFIKPIARIAVPIFFMITGYFYSSICEAGRQRIQIRKILLIAIFSNVLYLLWALLIELLAKGSISAKFTSWLDAGVWIRFLFLNESPFRSHLWYLSALIYVLIIVYRLGSVGIYTNSMYSLIPLLLCTNLVLGNYSVLIFERAVDLEFSRNFLFIGLPCFLFGDLLFRRANSIQLRNAYLWLILIFSIILTYLERIWLVQNNAFQNSDFFIGTIFTAYAIFSLVKNNPRYFQNKVALTIAWMGRELSLGLYIFNVIVRTIMVEVIKKIGSLFPAVEAVCFYITPLIMLCATSIVTFCLVYFKKEARVLFSERNSRK